MTVSDLVLLPFRLLWGLLQLLPIFSYKHVDHLKTTMTRFESKFNKGNSDSIQELSEQDKARRENYRTTTSTFYNLITDFYEYGWGQSFHFAPRHVGETFDQSIVRYEHTVASLLNISVPWHPKQVVLDVGCGIGGPMRSVSRFFKGRVRIEGINITEEHLFRAKRFNEQRHIKNCSFIHGDFNEIPRPDNHYDGIYDFEATLHSTDLRRTFAEIYRVLKPGGRFVTAQYCLLADYDSKNEEHREIVRRVDNTNGCYISGRTVESTTRKLEEVGFKVLSTENVFDKSSGNTISFHEVFESTKGGRFTGTKLGLWATWLFTNVGERLGVLPKGTCQVQEMLMGAADSFKLAGRMNILTPGQLYVLEKPLK